MKKRNLSLLFLILSLVFAFSKPALSQDESPTSGGDVGAESISGSATDENGNTTTFDSQGNITGQSGPDGGPVSDGTTQGPGATGQGDAANGGGPPAGATAPNEAQAAFSASSLAQAEANLNAALAAQELYGNEPFGYNTAVFNQIADALQAWDAAISQYGAAMQTANPSFSWDLSTSFATFDPAASLAAIGSEVARTGVAGNPNPAAAPAAPPVAPAPIQATAPQTSPADLSGFKNAPTNEFASKPETLNPDGTVGYGFQGSTGFGSWSVSQSSLSPTGTTVVSFEGPGGFNTVQTTAVPSSVFATPQDVANFVSSAANAGILTDTQGNKVSGLAGVTK